ncbi:hypothetical protein N7478_001087 [Penicillium angulare]|uniref:uncharacterized protein n=1 Tax=Penicillium angulare TaxID=116970 RepID=UPI00254146C7|nr:uncharacterized protein N7478_001087 [Penicillium angulare]KAJ5291836.1 hypothetical protein N7478_001087 [Penicillium angulare]
MGSIVANHVPSNPIDTMLGANTVNSVNSDVYSHATLDARSRSSSNNTTPTSSTTAPPPVGSTWLPAHSNEIPAYIASHHSNSSREEFHPPPSMTPSNYAPPSDYSYSSSHTTPQHPPGHVPMANMNPMTSSTAPPYTQSPDSPRLQPTHLQSLGGSEANSPSRIRVRSLSHIQSLASEEFLAPPHRSHLQDQHGAPQRQFEISSMPVGDIIEMVAGLLTKITTTNDLQHEHGNRQMPPPDGTTNLSAQATSVLAFHGKNVPSITILSYLTRIHKYCPTTYEVFLSLLVYFDRMTDLVNRGQPDRSQPQYEHTAGDHQRSTSLDPMDTTADSRQMHDPTIVTPPSSAGISAQDPNPNSSISPALYSQGEDDSLSHFFVVDSFNIHRLVIAGVTCASKFFSDVFYTNSRYAKVGGLPLVELNHLELQFLLLNDFRLAIPVEELESYGTMLVEFYAREIVSQQQAAVPRPIVGSTSDTDAMYMRSSREKRRDPTELGQTPTPP